MGMVASHILWDQNIFNTQPSCCNCSVLPILMYEVHLTSYRTSMVYSATCLDPAGMRQGVKHLNGLTGIIRKRKVSPSMMCLKRKTAAQPSGGERMRTHTALECRVEKLAEDMGQIQELLATLQQHCEVQSW